MTENIYSYDTGAENSTASNETADNFLSSLSEDLRGEQSLKDFKDVNGLAKSYVNANKMLGSRIAIPGENSTPEELNGFYAKLGRPESHDKYSVDPEDKSELTNKFRETAFKAGLSDKQAKEIYGMFSEEAKNIQKANEENNKNLEAQFNKEFGANLESVKNNVSKILSEYSPENALEILDKTTPEVQMTLIKIFDNMVKKSNGEGVLKNGNQTLPSSIEDLIKKRGELMTRRNYDKDPEFLSVRDEIDRRFLNGIK
jgi:hypothetical protein